LFPGPKTISEGSVRNHAHILVMDKETIIEEGKFGELISKGGYFAEFAVRQHPDTDKADAH